MRKGGRVKGSTNLITRELKHQLVLHASNELNVVLSRLNELPLAERYKMLVALMRILIPRDKPEGEYIEPPIIQIHGNL